jgi:hypothetical protein
MRHVHVWVDCHREALKIICSSWTGFNQQALSMMPLQRRLGSSCQQSLTNTPVDTVSATPDAQVNVDCYCRMVCQAT